MRFTQDVYSLVAVAVEANPTDPEAATEQAMQEIQTLPNYQAMVFAFIRAAIKEQVYQERHAVIRKMKNENGGYKKPQQVHLTESASVQRASRSIYLYYIGGTVLGELTKEKLLATAQSEEAAADGHMFNARLCMQLYNMVGEGQKVKDAVSEKRLKKMFEDLQKV